MHHDSGKIQAIHSSITALGLLRKKKDERNAWATISSTPTDHAIPIYKLKVASKHGCLCTARLDGPNHDSFDTMKDSGETLLPL